MKLTISSALTFFTMIFLTAKTAYSQDVKPLIETERKFCNTLVETGLSNAFVRFLANDGIIFRPTPINGKDFYTKNTIASRSLFWEPEVAGMSAGKDFGYTTGPFKAIREIKENDTVYAYGHYITVWQLLNGEWKALYDGGISYNKKYKDNHLYEYSPVNKTAEKPMGRSDTSLVINQISSLEKEYSKISSENGEKEAFVKYAADNVRLNRPKEFPFQGKNNSMAYLEKNNSKYEFNVMGIKAAPAGDMAFSYGTGEAKDPAAKFSFMKLWEYKNDKWEIIIDTMLFYK